MQSHRLMPGGRAHGSHPTVSLRCHLLDGGQPNAPRRQGSCHCRRPWQRPGHLRRQRRRIPVHHPRVCSVTRQDWLGKFYDGDGISETLLHPGSAPPAMRTTPVAGEVGRRAGYTPTAGNPCSMDIPVPIGARPHIRHDHQSPQERTSRGDRKPTINGSRELNGGRQVSSQVQPLGLNNYQWRAARVLVACHQGSQNEGGHLSTNSTAATHCRTEDAWAIIFQRENHFTAPPL
jgi:hypothetical protein